MIRSRATSRLKLDWEGLGEASWVDCVCVVTGVFSWDIEILRQRKKNKNFALRSIGEFWHFGSGHCLIPGQIRGGRVAKMSLALGSEKNRHKNSFAPCGSGGVPLSFRLLAATNPGWSSFLTRQTSRRHENKANQRLTLADKFGYDVGPN